MFFKILYLLIGVIFIKARIILHITYMELF